KSLLDDTKRNLESAKMLIDQANKTKEKLDIIEGEIKPVLTMVSMILSLFTDGARSAVTSGRA
ncbi:11553_t:CDS:2, partial [Racocetra persica]